MDRCSPDRACSRVSPCGVLCALLLVVSACKDEPPAGPSVGTNSNWLRACATADECGELPACECGACTAPCETDGECADIGDARCALGADPAAWAECETRSPTLQGGGLCLPRCDPGSCGDGQACVSGACVLAALPDTPFCSEVAAWDAGLRTREEELLQALQALRAAGGAQCETNAGPAAVAPALRLDPRLTCAARVFARDVDATRAPGLEDSLGRTTPERLQAAGYAQRLWGESFAFDARNAEQALELMTSANAGTCMRLTGADLTDVGVGAAGETLVVTIATQ